MFASIFSIKAQLVASDTSERSVMRHKNLIQNNKEVVTFIEYSLTQKGLPKHLNF